jgi:hypothetical protein
VLRRHFGEPRFGFDIKRVIYPTGWLWSLVPTAIPAPGNRLDTPGARTLMLNRAMAMFAFKDMHDLSDPLDGALGVLRIAVPNAPVQTLDSATITVFAVARSGSSAENAAANFVCCERIAIRYEFENSRIHRSRMAKTPRKPGQPSVKAVNWVASVRSTISRIRWIMSGLSSGDGAKDHAGHRQPSRRCPHRLQVAFAVLATPHEH